MPSLFRGSGQVLTLPDNVRYHEPQEGEYRARGLPREGNGIKSTARAGRMAPTRLVLLAGGDGEAEALRDADGRRQGASGADDWGHGHEYILRHLESDTTLYGCLEVRCVREGPSIHGSQAGSARSRVSVSSCGRGGSCDEQDGRRA